MMNVHDLGRLLLILGGVIALVGLGLLFIGRVPLLGRLPGDINIQRGNTSFSFPIVTCLLLSVALTILINALLFLFRRH